MGICAVAQPVRAGTENTEAKSEPRVCDHGAKKIFNNKNPAYSVLSAPVRAGLIRKKTSRRGASNLRFAAQRKKRKNEEE